MEIFHHAFSFILVFFTSIHINNSETPTAMEVDTVGEEESDDVSGGGSGGMVVVGIGNQDGNGNRR